MSRSDVTHVKAQFITRVIAHTMAVTFSMSTTRICGIRKRRSVICFMRILKAAVKSSSYCIVVVQLFVMSNTASNSDKDTHSCSLRYGMPSNRLAVMYTRNSRLSRISLYNKPC